MFYIISLKHTHKHENFITLWRKNNAGYCYSKGHAGLYEKPEKGYHDSDNAMPISEELADEMFEDVLYEGKYERKMIRNNAQNRQRLGVKYYKKELVKNR